MHLKLNKIRNMTLKNFEKAGAKSTRKIFDGLLPEFKQKQNKLKRVKIIIGKFPDKSASILRSWIRADY